MNIRCLMCTVNDLKNVIIILLIIINTVLVELEIYKCFPKASSNKQASLDHCMYFDQSA